MENRDTDKLNQCRSESCAVDTAGIRGHNREESHTESSQSPRVDSLQAPDEEARTYTYAVKAVQRIAGKECPYSQDEISTDNQRQGSHRPRWGVKYTPDPTNKI